MPFPFPPPPEGSRLPRIADYTRAQVAEILDWVVRTHTNHRAGLATSSLKGTALRRWYETNVAPPLPNAGGTGQTLPIVGGTDARSIRAAMFDIRESLKLAWSLAVLHARNAEISSGAFEDLLLSDWVARQNDVPMPQGTATFYQAARLMQAAGGQVQVFGSESKGRDILWRTKGGATASIERKDRAFFHTYDSSKTDGFMKTKFIEASEGLPTDGSARIVAIGFSTTVIEAAQLQVTFKERLLRLLGGLPHSAWPDAAYGAFVGYELRGEHEEAVDSGIFVPLGRNGFRARRAFSSVEADFKKVYRVKRR